MEKGSTSDKAKREIAGHNFFVSSDSNTS